MSQTRVSAPDLSPLEKDYDIVGELDAPDGSRSYIGRRKAGAGKRRDDQMGVLISILTPPGGDEANALTLLAADTQVLARLSHRRLVPVLEGRWLADDVYALVTQRVTDPSLAQRLAAGERFTNPRIAAILREVNGLLEWARGQKIVHRSVTADRVFLEPTTDRVRVSFGIAPIRRIRRSDVDEDARTIVRLAVGMLTGNPDSSGTEDSLAELRPDLPDRLVETTLSLLDEKRTGTAADAAAYLALVGMADPLAEGETERERIRSEILDEQRMERDKLAAERAVFEQEMATKRAEFAREMALEREKLAADRTELERVATAEREELRRALTNERAQLAAKREELEAAVAAHKAAMERAAVEDRRRIDALRAAIQRAGELEVEKKRLAALDEIADQEIRLDEGELATPLFVPPVLPPLAELSFDDRTPVLNKEPIVFPLAHEPAGGGAEKPPFAAVLGTAPEGKSPAAVVGSGQNQRRWILTGAAAGLVAIAAASAIAVAHRHQSAPPVVTKAAIVSPPLAAVPASIVPLPPPAPTTIVDSSAGRLAPRSDSLSRLARRRTTDSARTRAAAIEAPKPRFLAADSGTQRTTAQRESTRRDAANRRRAMSLGDSLFNFREPTPPRRDSAARPDTTP